ncbi:MAG: pentapeptide repeat-containing protein, partial [Chthoniobacteraceae bacterium]|nr:pentapeptide repeat-containing protein [Chthoniobacteraceae bacterium]
YLGGADLRGAYLGGAYLGDAYLGGAYLGGAYLGTDENPIKAIEARQIGPIGSRADFSLAFRTDKGLHFRAGCFFGTAEEFEAKVLATHGVTGHGADYADWINLAERWDARRKLEEAN